MLLAIDIGNSNIVFGIFDSEDLISHWRIGTDKSKTADEYGILLKNLIDLRDIKDLKVTRAIIASVVPTLKPIFVELVKTYFTENQLLVEPGTKTGMPVLYHNPKEVGADRIVNGVAAYDRYKNSVVVVDFGTATTFDCISKEGEYLGGLITPGLHISAEALFQNASKLPRVEVSKPKTIIGKTTVESIQSGIVYGYAGLVDGIVKKIKLELDDNCNVIATGGMAELISSESETIEDIDEFLTLKGLRIISNIND